MSDKLDMALDDIIKSKRGSSRGGGGGGRGRGGGRGGRGGRVGGGPGGRPSFRGSRPMSNGAGRSGMTSGRWSHDMYQGGGGGGGGGAGPRSNPMPGGPIKVNISNLDFGVSDSDIRELFQEFGDMRSGTVHYDRSGRSLGSAEVVFGRYSDAQKAVKQYNGVHLDGRPMKIYLEEEKSGSRGPGSRPMVKRLNQGGRGGSGMRRGRGGSRGGRGGGGGSQKEKTKTAEELDAELDSYVSEAQKSK